MATRIYSGASPQQIAEELIPLVDFQDEGMPLPQLKKLVEERLIPHLMLYNQPGFQSMFNTFLEKGAELGAHIALTYNQGVTNWQVSPGGVVLEELCCKALCHLFGFSADADATFMYSGTYANQQALYLALHQKAEQEGFNLGKKGLQGFQDPEKLAVVASHDAHYSLRHAVRMLGLGDRSLITVPVDKNRRMNVETLKKILKKAQNVFCIVATTGTTSTGAVDPVLPISELCKNAKIWLHVDGAYGLAYSLVPEWNPLFSGVERADSVCWDPHKQMGVPIPNSVLFVKRKENFDRMAMYSSYFSRRKDTEPNPGLKSPPSTRPFSALPLVTSLRYQGMKKVVERLCAPLIAVKTVAETLRSFKDIEVCHTPDTGILCFRMVPEGVPEHTLNQLHHNIYRRILAEGTRTISLTTLDEKTVLRLVAVSPAVTSEALMETVSHAQELAHEYLNLPGLS
ncbi:MAG: aspartate aminotransferase family protein [Theionarchaea archaeon]|nr:aspartate aminotransferase family protein [Theionarchaea archaeon]